MYHSHRLSKRSSWLLSLGLLIFQPLAVALSLLADRRLDGLSDAGFAIGCSLAVLACICQIVLSSFRQFASSIRLGGLCGAFVAGAGWASWVLVALTSQPGDPVINIAGLLVLPGLLIWLVTLIVSGAMLRKPDGSSKVGSPVFFVIQIAIFLFQLIQVFTFDPMSSEFSSFWFFGPMLLSVAVAAVQLVFAALASPTTDYRNLSIISAIILMIGSEPFFLPPFITELGLGLLLFAAIREFQATRQKGDAVSS